MILYVVENLGVAGMGGGIAACFELQALLETGHPVTILTRHEMDLTAIVSAAHINHVTWITWGDVDVPFPPECSLAYVRSQVKLIRRTNLIRSLKPDLIVVQGVEAHRRIEMYRSWEGIPRLMTLHGSPDQFSGLYHDGVDRLTRARKEMAAYTGLVQLGPIMAKTWAKQPGLENIPAHIIYNTIDEKQAVLVASTGKHELRDELRISGGTFALTCAASVQFRKGQDLLLDAMPALMQKYPRLILYLAGPVVPGWGGREILRQVERHPFKNRIHLIGAVSHAQALRWIKASDCFILPSREEAMPLSILEAMYLGTPVIASNVNGIPDEIDDGKTGLLFSHDDPGGLSRAVDRMIADGDFRSACAARGRIRYDSMFTLQSYKSRWAEIVQELIKK